MNEVNAAHRLSTGRKTLRERSSIIIHVENFEDAMRIPFGIINLKSGTARKQLEIKSGDKVVVSEKYLDVPGVQKRKQLKDCVKECVKKN